MVEGQADYSALLRQVEYFRSLDDAQLGKVAQLVHRRRFLAGETIFYQEDAGDCLYIITEGYVRISLLSSDGRELTLRVYKPGNSFGEFAVLDGKPRSACATAVNDVTTLVIYRDDFQGLLLENVDLLLYLVEVLTERLRFTTLFSQSLAFLSATERIVAALLQLAEQPHVQVEPNVIRVTQEELASFADVTREWANQALRKLARDELIQIGRGRVTLLDRERLRVWTDG